MASKTLEDDLDFVTANFELDAWSFHDFKVVDSNETVTVMFSAKNSLEPKEYEIILSKAEYPDNTVMTSSCWDCPQVIDRFSLSTIIDNLNMGETEETSTSLVVARSMSVESEESNYEDCHSEVHLEYDEEDYEEDDDIDAGDDDDGFDYEDDELFGESSHIAHPMLLEDIRRLKSLFGSECLEFRVFETIEEIDIEMKINLLGYIEREIAQAWGLSCNEPLIIRLLLALDEYLDSGSIPKVEVFQVNNEVSGICCQLKKILERFLSENWGKVSNEKLCAIHKYQEYKEQGIADSAEWLSTKSAESSPVVVMKEDVSKLLAQGHSQQEVKDALVFNLGDVSEAVGDLSTNKDRPELLKPVNTENTSTQENDSATKSSFLSLPKITHRQSSHPGHPDRKKPASKKRKPVLNPLKVDTTAGINLVPSSTWLGKNAKLAPNLEFGFLAQMYQYAKQRIPTLNEYCVVCDEPHVFQNGAMLKPAVCSRELCVFAFQTLGVMVNAADNIATGAEVVGLLLAMSKAACNSHRNHVIFEPYPTVVDPRKKQELAFNPKSKDYKKVKEVINAIGNMAELSKIAPSYLKDTLDRLHILAYPLLQWIVSSNRSHIVKLPVQKQLEFMKTPHQFLLMSSPPAKEARFRELKALHGSTFAFHGSGIENWHSIIREGLIVASGTNRQVNGAAYGKGIYLSPCSSTSFGYSKMGYRSSRSTTPSSKSRFLTSENITCIALCEVILHNLKKTGTIWVSPESDYVCTRFFFVYEDGEVGENINTETQKNIQRLIQEAVSYRS